ncbi:MAG: type VI secretion system accessory protein TagJ [Acetobacteraceae bacterium]|nr:type VI secretion system accessory protein TagJ [Acetobacteraceae bacterium]
MSESTEAGNLFKAGHLDEAIAAANAAVRKSPADLSARVLLAELLLFAGNLDRADLVLDAAADLTPDAAIVIAEFRQLLRGEQARRQLSRDGRLPEMLAEPTPAISATLAAYVALRSGDPAAAAQSLEAAEATRPPVSGDHDETAFDDLRDADDLCAGFFEVLTTTGKYYWIPTERVESVLFHPPVRPRDLFWRRATMSVRGGPDGDVYLPALYVSDAPDLAESLRLGRETDWRQEGNGPTRGLGQRMFLVGEEACGIMELGTLTFGGAEAAPAGDA